MFPAGMVAMRTLGKRVQFTSRVDYIFDAVKVPAATGVSSKATRTSFHYARTLDCGILICWVRVLGAGWVLGTVV